MISAGDLDRWITIERATGTPNAFNEMILTWGVFISVPAKRQDVSDGEKFAAGQVGASLTTRFLIRSSPNARTITAKDRLIHEGSAYNILGVKEAEHGRRMFLEITTVREAD